MGGLGQGKLLVTRVLFRIVILAAVAAVAIVIATKASAADPWKRAWVTGYSTRENLTGCYAPGKYPWQQRLCRTACGKNLDDRKYWVAANPRWGLGCGQVLQICKDKRCVYAQVMDATASAFDFEFTYALAVATGAPRSYPGFADPRFVVWRKVYGRKL